MQKSYCKNFSGVAITRTDDDIPALLMRLRCKQWSCPFCAEQNRRMWKNHIIERIQAMGGDWIFITITAHGNAHRAGKTIENLKSAWKKLYDRLRYKFAGQKMEYVWIYERHTSEDKYGAKKTRYHVHAILRASIAGDNKYNARKEYYYHPELHAWLKDNTAQVGAGYMCHAVKIEGGEAGLIAGYIVKYMTKDCQDLGKFPKGYRRVTTSRGFGSPKPKHEEKWEYRAHILKGEVMRRVKITDVSIGKVVTMASFGDGDLYPIPEDGNLQ